MFNEITNNLGDTWRKFSAGDMASRNALVEAYLPFVQATAKRVHAKLVNQIELDDLISTGVFGLIDALNSFDPRRGVKFETFCLPRIRGAMLDELRRMDWVPRLVRFHSRKLNSAVQSIKAASGQNPTEEELADNMGMTIGKAKAMLKDSFVTGQISLDHLSHGSPDSDNSFVDTLPDRKQTNPSLSTLRKELKDIILKKLTRTERLIITLYHYEGMQMKEIGKTMDLSESRISQIYTDLLARLKGMLEGRQPSINAAA